uniref:Sulfurtransferase TusA family protein n=1 Tax=Leptospirillum ferriphilum TaxID=178606 RepID=A0A7C3QTS1_9BACT
MLSSGDLEKNRFLEVTGLFNPVDCQSLGVIRTNLKSMEAGEVLTVICNRFQQREIASWTKKFRHHLLTVEDIDGQVTLKIRKGDSG